MLCEIKIWTLAEWAALDPALRPIVFWGNRSRGELLGLWRLVITAA